MTAPCSTTGPYAYDLNVQVLWVEAIADVLEPTDDEIATGADLQATYELSDITGWLVSTARPGDDNWSAREGQRIGQQSTSESQLIFPAYLDGQDIRSLLARGDAGYIVILPSGPYLEQPDAPVHVFKVRVAQISQLHQLRDGSSSTIRVTFAVSRFIGENVFVVETS